MPLETAILETLAYSDVFDYPLTLDELYHFLVESASRQDVELCASKLKDIILKDGYFFLAGRDEIVELRKKREFVSCKIHKRAMFYGRILGVLPFVRMVALTGSLALLNLSRNPDMDYMLVAEHGRVWTARAFAIFLGKIARLLGDTLCPNIIVSERALEWPVRDLYTARELYQMIPVTGFDMYRDLLAANKWTELFLPNAYPKSPVLFTTSNLWRVAEYPLQGDLGDKLESWEMTRKIARFSKQADFSEETVFTVDVCQGNFHHHRKWTLDLYQRCLSTLGVKIDENLGMNL